MADFKDYGNWSGKKPKIIHARYGPLYERGHRTACGKDVSRCTTAYAADDPNTHRDAVTCKDCLAAMEEVHFSSNRHGTHACQGNSQAGGHTSNPRKVTCRTCSLWFQTHREPLQNVQWTSPLAQLKDFDADGLLCETCGCGDTFSRLLHPDTGKQLPHSRSDFRSTLRDLDEGYHGILHNCTLAGERVRLLLAPMAPEVKDVLTSLQQETIYLGVECPFYPEGVRRVPIHASREAWQDAWDTLMKGHFREHRLSGCWGAWESSNKEGVWYSRLALNENEEHSALATMKMPITFMNSWFLSVNVSRKSSVEGRLVYMPETYEQVIEAVGGILALINLVCCE